MKKGTLSWIAVLQLLLTVQTAEAADLPWWQATTAPSFSAIAPEMESVATAVIWGSGAELPVNFSWVRQRAAAAHAKCRKYISAISTYDAAWETYQARPELLASAVIDIDGQRAIVQWESTAERQLAWCNTNHPVWQAFLLEQGRNLVDAGVDGIVIDEMGGTWQSVSAGGSFGEPDMTLFREYLKTRYTAAELSSRFGIGTISTFNYGEYLRSRGLAATWRSAPWQAPLYADYDAFQREAVVAFMQRLVSETRGYAWLEARP